MTLNRYFNNHGYVPTQNLVEDLIIESIRIYGYEVQYIPREGNTPDTIFKEDASSEYNSAYPIEMYIKSFDGYEGDGQFLSRFGIEIRHQVTLTVAIKSFLQQVGEDANLPRPLEGDLIYFGLDNKLFVIKNVYKYGVFYQAGTLQTYDLICEMFEYSGEKLNTGIEAVDAIETAHSLSTLAHALRDVNGDLVLDADGKPQFDPDYTIDDLTGDENADNSEIGDLVDDLIDATDDNIMSETF